MTLWRSRYPRNVYPSSRLRSLLLLSITTFLTACQSYIRSTESSQNGQFCIVVRSYPMLIAMPGQGSDAPGEVNLYDMTGQKLESASLEMVQLFEGATWATNQVMVDLGLNVETWQLPQEQENQPDSREPSDACTRFELEKSS